MPTRCAFLMLRDGSDGVPHSRRISLTVSGIEIVGYHGATQEERRSGCRLVVDVEASGDLGSAVAADDLQNTVDYRRVERTVLAVNRRSQYTLIESLANAIAEQLLHDHSILNAVTVRVSKRQPAGMGARVAAGVELELKRP